MKCLNCEKRLYVSTACLDGKQDIASVLSRYLNLGFKNVELSSPHEYRPLEELADLLSGFKSWGMNFIFHNYFPAPKEEFVLNLVSQDEAIRLKSKQLISNAVNLSEKLGVDLYCCHPGYLGDPIVNAQGMFRFNKNSALKKEKCFEILVTDFMKYYQSIGLESSGQNLFVGFENLFPQGDGNNYSIFCTKEDIRDVFETDIVRSSNLGLLIDLGHLSISSNLLGFDRENFIDEIIEKYGNRIYEVHLSENDGTIDQHAEICQDSWQLTVLGKFRHTGSRLKGGRTRFCLESRRLTPEQLVSSYNLVKNRLEDLL